MSESNIKVGRIQDFERWIPKGSYSFGAWETYNSDLFEFRSGPHVSLLSVKNSDIEIKFKGCWTVDSDDTCWKLIHKFKFTSQMVSDLMANAKIEGYNEAKIELSNWISELRC